MNMQLFNQETIKFLKSKKVCWYPSSGADINSINFWRNGFGNEIIPDVFIFTDIAFNIMENSLSMAENENMINSLNGIGFEKIEYREVYDIENFRRVLINDADLLNKLDLSVMNDLIKEKEVDTGDISELLELKEIGLLENSDVLKDIKYLAFFNNHFNEILNRNLSIIQNDSELTDIYPQRILHFKNEELNTELVFIKSNNDIFYNICIENSIKIPCFQLKRPNDELFTGFNLSTLSIKEAIIRDQDLEVLHSSDNFSIINSFQWTTHYGDDDFAKLIRLD